MNTLKQLKNKIEKLADFEGVHLEHPKDLAHGDYSTNIALVLAKESGESSIMIADRLAKQLRAEYINGIEKIETAGPGFINFYLSRDFLSDSLNKIKKDKNWGANNEMKGKKVIVEYTDPNPFKEMHIGHMMSNSIGESIARLLEFTGAKVRKVTYQGDVGPHVAKALYGMQRMESIEDASDLGRAYALGNSAYENDETAKEEIDSINVDLYAGLKGELLKLYNKGKEISLQDFEKIYEILGSDFARNFFESESAVLGTKLVQKGLKKGIFEESEGAIIYSEEQSGLHTRVFMTSRGTPAYEAKELGLPKLKQSWWGHNKSVIITAKEQKAYFDVVLSAMAKLMPKLAGKTEHISHGLLKLPEGKMSSRSGNIVSARELISLVFDSVKDKSPDEKIAQDIAVGAIKYAILKQKAGDDIVFDINKSISTEGDSGPYLQYAIVRAKKILKDSNCLVGSGPVPEQIFELEKLLYRFPEIVLRAQEDKAPHHIATFATQIAGVFNNFYTNEKVIGDKYEGFKLLLLKDFVKTMEQALYLLGIRTPEKM